MAGGQGIRESPHAVPTQACMYAILRGAPTTPEDYGGVGTPPSRSIGVKDRRFGRCSPEPAVARHVTGLAAIDRPFAGLAGEDSRSLLDVVRDRKSTRLNSSH